VFVWHVGMARTHGVPRSKNPSSTRDGVDHAADAECKAAGQPPQPTSSSSAARAAGGSIVRTICYWSLPHWSGESKTGGTPLAHCCSCSCTSSILCWHPSKGVKDSSKLKAQQVFTETQRGYEAEMVWGCDCC
jgi:hypothetical protein